MNIRKPRRFEGKVDEYIQLSLGRNWKYDGGNALFENRNFYNQRFYGFSPIVYFKNFVLEKSGKYILIRYRNRIHIQLYEKKILHVLIDNDNALPIIRILDDFIRECLRRNIRLTWIDYVHPAKWENHIRNKTTK